MDDYGALYRRIVELEVEAKFHRAEIERLKGTIAHLVGTVGGQYFGQQANEIWLQNESNAFRADLAGSNGKHIGMGSIGCGDVVPLERAAVGEQREGTDYKPSESSGASDRAETGSVRNGSDGTQLFQVDLIDLGNDLSSPVQDSHPASKIPAISPSPARGVDSTQHIQKKSTYTVVRPGAPWSVTRPPFYDHERRKIMGFATWIEDWTEDEVDNGWAEFAKANQSHTAEEWRRYYETEIRVHLVEKGQIQNKKEVEMAPPAIIVDTSHTVESQCKSSDGRGAECHEASTHEQPTGYSETNDHEKDFTTDESVCGLDIQRQQIDIPSSCLLSSSGNHKISRPESIMGDRTGNIQMVDDDCAKPDSNFCFEHVDSKTFRHERMADAENSRNADLAHVEIYSEQLHPTIAEHATDVLTQSDTPATLNISDTRAAEVPSCTDTDDVENRGPRLPTTGGLESTSCSVLTEARVLSTQNEHSTNHSQAMSTLPDPKEFGDARVRPDRIRAGQRKDMDLRSSVWPGEDQDVRRNLRSDDESLQHTAMVFNIKPGTTLSTVLNSVRGGRIVSATYIETSKRIRNVKTDVVMVVFFVAAQARAYVDFCAENTIGIKAAMIESPTFSCALKKHRSLAPCRDLSIESRVIYLDHPDLSMTTQQTLSELENLRLQLEEPLKRPLLVKQDENGRIFVEFASVLDARAAKTATSGSGGTLRSCSRGFAGDPCEGPLQELLRGLACDTCQAE
nr:hypothetical protein CFP56_04541 [Quercus suber]